MLKKMLMVAALSMAGVSAYAVDAAQVEKSIELKLSRKVVGIEIEITALTGKSKLSQNKEPRDRLQAAETLATRGRDELAQAMREAG